MTLLFSFKCSKSVASNNIILCCRQGISPVYALLNTRGYDHHRLYTMQVITTLFTFQLTNRGGAGSRTWTVCQRWMGWSRWMDWLWQPHRVRGGARGQGQRGDKSGNIRVHRRAKIINTKRKNTVWQVFKSVGSLYRYSIYWMWKWKSKE